MLYRFLRLILSIFTIRIAAQDTLECSSDCCTESMTTSDDITDKTFVIGVAQTFDMPHYTATPECDGIFLRIIQCYQDDVLIDTPDFITMDTDAGTITLDTDDVSYVGTYFIRLRTAPNSQPMLSEVDEFYIYAVDC